MAPTSTKMFQSENLMQTNISVKCNARRNLDEWVNKAFNGNELDYEMISTRSVCVVPSPNY